MENQYEYKIVNGKEFYKKKKKSTWMQRCQEPGCKSCVQGGTMFCVSHGGGKRCQSDACSIYNERERAYGGYKHSENQKYYCYNCYINLVGPIGKSYIRQEHLILAEIMRLSPKLFERASMCQWDCPAPCTLKRPDLMIELSHYYVIFEVDEYGHSQSNDRIMELQRSLCNKSLIMFRINPNRKNNKILKQKSNANGVKIWNKTKIFNNAMNLFKKIINDEINNFNYEDKMYKEIGYNFDINKTPKDRNYKCIKTDWGFIINP